MWRPLPNVIFGSLGFFAVLCATFLPETKGKGLPESIEDAIAIVNKYVYWIFVNFYLVYCEFFAF